MTKTKFAYPFENIETGMTDQSIDAFKHQVRSILENSYLLEDQKRNGLVDAAFKTLEYPQVSEAAIQAIGEGTICLINEGPAPYHPRYVAPDFQVALDNGSDFFGLQPAVNLNEAITNLLTLYNYSPSAGPPPYIGRIDRLLEPYVEGQSTEVVIDLLKMFWTLVDRLHPDAFVHANIGPEESKIGSLLLDIDDSIKTITNLTLRYDKDVTQREFALKAVRNAMHLAKPYFLNHPVHLKEWGQDYVVASCYNVMRLGGGIFTLVRLNLSDLAKRFEGSLDELLEETLPELVSLQMEVINSRIRYLVEGVEWFENSIFVKEGLLHPDNFTAYAGVVGLNELVNQVMALKGKPECLYGHDDEANQIALSILTIIKSELMKHEAAYCHGTDGKIVFHAQVGISEDQETTPGCRIPAATEPDLYSHLRTAAPIQKLVEGGISDIFEFDQTAKNNPEAILDIIDGAMALGIRDLSIGCVDSEYIRVSGYLVRRADLERSAK
jgi:YjjI family glycine radical enzyme